jgi:hypothetical protein
MLLTFFLQKKKVSKEERIFRDSIVESTFFEASPLPGERVRVRGQC